MPIPAVDPVRTTILSVAGTIALSLAVASSACSKNDNVVMIEQVEKAAEGFCACKDRPCQEAQAEAFKVASKKLLMHGKELTAGQQALTKKASKRMSECVRADSLKSKP